LGTRRPSKKVTGWKGIDKRLGGPSRSSAGWKPGAFELNPSYGVELPPSYLGFMKELGPGTLGGFLHFQPPGYLNSYRERMAPFLDSELEAALVDSGEILIFADSDNGDCCGWQLAELGRSAEPEVVRIPPRSFDAVGLGCSFGELFERLTDGADVFRIGPLQARYQPMKPF